MTYNPNQHSIVKRELPPPCHNDGQYLFNIGKASIHAGALSARTIKPAWDLVISLTGTSQMSPTLTGHNGAQKIARTFIQGSPRCEGYPELVVDWADGHAPDVTKKEWLRLIKDLRVFNGRVLIHCVGGHGRTGTLLAILAHLSGVVKGDPVTWVREQYCAKTVETQRQITYLKEDMWIKTNEAPRYVPHVPPQTPLTLLNGDLPEQGQTFGSWWAQEEQALTRGYIPEAPELSRLYRCALCMIHKRKSLMHSTFLDGTGYCIRCNVDTSAAMEGISE